MLCCLQPTYCFLMPLKLLVTEMLRVESLPLSSGIIFSTYPWFTKPWSCTQVTFYFTTPLDHCKAPAHCIQRRSMFGSIQNILGCEHFLLLTLFIWVPLLNTNKY